MLVEQKVEDAPQDVRLERQARPYSKAALLQKGLDARDDAKAAAKRASDAATFAKELAEKMEAAHMAIAKALDEAAAEREDRKRWALTANERWEALEGSRRWNRRLAATLAVQTALTLAYLAWAL